MTCPDCFAAMSNPRWSLYRNDCHECQARLIAGGMEYLESEVRGKPTDGYKRRLETLGATSIRAAHEMCRRWRERLDSMQTKEKV